jgi:hypothetical protein
VIEAMREPTEAMVLAGRETPMTPYDVWRAMAREALK